MNKALAILFSIFAGFSLPAEKLTVDQLNAKKKFPSWAKPVKTNFNPKKMWMTTESGRGSRTAMQRCVGKMMYLIRDKKSDLYPFWMLKLANNLCDLNEDNAACQVISKIFALPNNTRLKKGLYAYNNFADIKKDAMLILARIYARNGNADEALKLLETVKINNGYEKVRQAEILTLAGKETKDLLSQSYGHGHPEKGFSDFFIRMRATMLARASGFKELVDSIASPVISKPQKTQKWPQFQSSWAIMKKFNQNNKKPLQLFSELKNGTYKGTCRGFDKDIEVSVKVADGKVSEVRVVKQKESRPWSALSVIPDRIVSQQSLKVDAVTHATVTSCAVVAAVDEALKDASKESK